MKLKYDCEIFQNSLHKLWKTDKYCDVILITEDGKARISAHRVVLAACSPYFAEQTPNAAGNAEEIVVAAIDGTTLEQLVDVFYSGTLEIDENNVSNVYMGAMQLQLNNLLTTMDNYIMTQLNNSNCLLFYHLAQTLSRSVVFEATKTYICNNFVQISDQPSFLKLDTNKLKGLLALEGLIVPSPEDLFRNIIKWIQFDVDGQRVNVFPELLPNLRLSLMPSKFLLEHVKPHCKTVEASAFIFAALETQLDSISSGATAVKHLPVPVDLRREKLIVVEGYAIKEYNVNLQKWNILAKLPIDLHVFCVTYSTVLNSLCFIGGIFGASILNDVLLWNLQTRKFTKLPSMLEARANTAAVSINDGSDEAGDLYVFGGIGRNAHSLLTVERWTRKTGNWSFLEPIKEHKLAARLVQAGNLIYHIGGLYFSNSLPIKCYNLSEKRWSTIPELNHKRIDCGTWVDGEKIYVIGGGSDVIESYDPNKNEWIDVCTVIASETVKACVRHNNCLFAFGDEIVFTSDGVSKIWTKIEKKDNSGHIYGAFSISSQ